VAQDVRVELLGRERRRGRGCRPGVRADALLDGVAAEAAAGAGRKQRVLGTPGALGEPGFEDGLGGCGERDGALLSALAVLCRKTRYAELSRLLTAFLLLRAGRAW
jgi:hypothetical protein